MRVRDGAREARQRQTRRLRIRLLLLGESPQATTRTQVPRAAPLAPSSSLRGRSWLLLSRDCALPHQRYWFHAASRARLTHRNIPNLDLWPTALSPRSGRWTASCRCLGKIKNSRRPKSRLRSTLWLGPERQGHAPCFLGPARSGQSQNQGFDAQLKLSAMPFLSTDLDRADNHWPKQAGQPTSHESGRRGKCLAYLRESLRYAAIVDLWAFPYRAIDPLPARITRHQSAAPHSPRRLLAALRPNLIGTMDAATTIQESWRCMTCRCTE